jgi:hypothetical protein
MSGPDFIIIGAMKCGTTTLAAQLGGQSGVFLTTPKEPNFFSDDAVYTQGMAWYHSLFAGAGATDIKGEASTHYTKLPTHEQTVARLRDHVPAPRLVYMLRDPIERAVSHYIHEWSQGVLGADPIAAFETHPELTDYGRYAMQIRPFVESFGAESICVTSLERLKSYPAAELARVGAHIGMTAPTIWQDDLGAQNVSAQRVRKLPFHNLLVDNALATALRRVLVPKAVRARIRSARSMGARPELPDSLKEQLRAIYAQDLVQLAAIFPDTQLGFEDAYQADFRAGGPYDGSS